MPETTITSREQWLELRRNNVGASEVASLFGCQFSDAPSLFELWQIKSGRLPERQLSGDRVEAGILYEEATARHAAKTLGLELLKAGYWTHPRIKGMGCTPDYLCMAKFGGVAWDWLLENDINPENVGNLECKTVDSLEYKRAWNNEPPLRVLLQDQAQKSCIECDWGVLFSCIGGNRWEHQFTLRRQNTIDTIERRITEFWNSIETGQVPNIDGTKSTARAIASLYPEDNGDPPVDMSADNELFEFCANWQSFNAIRKASEADERRYANKILSKLGNHRSAFVNGWTVSAPTISEIPDREARPGEIIKGRKSYRRLSVRESTNE